MTEVITRTPTFKIIGEGMLIEPMKCESCEASCCRRHAPGFKLTDDEVNFMTEAGAQLREIPLKGLSKTIDVLRSAVGKNRDRKDYILEEDCPFLEDNQCTIYTDERRPRICREFPMGSIACHNFRRHFTDDPEEAARLSAELAAWPDKRPYITIEEPN